MKQRFPVPILDELLNRLHGSAASLAFGCVAPFLEIPVHPYYRHKIAFRTCKASMGILVFHSDW